MTTFCGLPYPQIDPDIPFYTLIILLTIAKSIFSDDSATHHYCLASYSKLLQFVRKYSPYLKWKNIAKAAPRHISDIIEPVNRISWTLDNNFAASFYQTDHKFKQPISTHASK